MVGRIQDLCTSLGVELKTRSGALLFVLATCALCFWLWPARVYEVPGDLIAGKMPHTASFTSAPARITDGVSGLAGTSWNSSVNSLIEPGGGVEWDLGAVKRVSAVWLEADDNDQYAVLVSTDERSWALAWEAPGVLGGGQQGRGTSELDVEARYVRLEPLGGDSRYSVAEFAVFDQVPSQWPPRLTQQPGRSPEEAQRVELWRELAVAAGLALLALLVPRSADDKKSARGASAWLHRPSPSTWILALAMALVAVTALRYRAEYRGATLDDAYISFQYAKHWSAGQGLVYNLGERVEGYTNFLWVALLAPLWSLSGQQPIGFTQLAFSLTLVLALVGLGALALVGRSAFGRRLPAVLAVLLVAFDDAYISYAVFSLENHLLIVCMLAGLASAVLRHRGWELALGVSFALVAMTRPDGLLWVLAFFAAYGPSLGARQAVTQRRTLARSLAMVALAFLVPWSAYFAWRYAYYGYLFPNTFYLKVGDTFAGVPRGLAYLLSYARERWWVPTAALLALVNVGKPWVRWLLAHLGLHTAYVVYVGGDFYPGHRFLLVVAPSVALLIASVVDRWLAYAKALPGWLGPRMLSGACCLAMRWGTLEDGPHQAEIRTWANTVDNQVRYMQWLKTVKRPGASMLVGDIGTAGFFADLRVVDRYGVVDPSIARKHVPGFGTGKAGHEKTATAQEVMARDPTYLKWGYLPGPTPPPDYYLFTDFPRSLRVEGLWVKDDLTEGRALPATAFHLGPTELSGFDGSGEAFRAIPTVRAVAGQRPVIGNVGPYLNSFSPSEGDRATGRLVSPAFPLVGDQIRLLVGGGRDLERLRVSLIVDGQAVWSVTGTNWETLGRREWDISHLRGKTGAIEIVDQATDAWGHIMVDEIEQWTGRARLPAKL